MFIVPFFSFLLQFLSLLSSPSSTVEQALHYSRVHLTPFWRMHKADVCRLMGCVAFFGRREASAPAPSQGKVVEPVDGNGGDDNDVLGGSQWGRQNGRKSDRKLRLEQAGAEEKGSNADESGRRTDDRVAGVPVRHAVGSGEEVPRTTETNGEAVPCSSFSRKSASSAEPLHGKRKAEGHVEKKPLASTNLKSAAARDKNEKRWTSLALASLGEGTPYKDLVSEAVWARVLNLFRKAFCETGLLLPVCRYPPLRREAVSSSCVQLSKVRSPGEGGECGGRGSQFSSSMVPALTMPPSSMLSSAGVQSEGWRMGGTAASRGAASRAGEAGERRARRSVLDSTELLVELEESSREDNRQQSSTPAAAHRCSSSFLSTQEDERCHQKRGRGSARGRLVRTTFYIPSIEDSLGNSRTAVSARGGSPGSHVRLILCSPRYGPTRPLGEGVSVSGRSVPYQERLDEERNTIADASAVAALKSGSGARAAVAAVARSGVKQLEEALRSEAKSLLSDIPLTAPIVPGTLYTHGQSQKRQRDLEKSAGPNWLRDCFLAPFRDGLQETDVCSPIRLPPLGAWSIRGQRFSRCSLSGNPLSSCPDNKEAAVYRENCGASAKGQRPQNRTFCAVPVGGGGVVVVAYTTPAFHQQEGGAAVDEAA